MAGAGLNPMGDNGCLFCLRGGRQVCVDEVEQAICNLISQWRRVRGQLQMLPLPRRTSGHNHLLLQKSHGEGVRHSSVKGPAFTHPAIKDAFGESGAALPLLCKMSFCEMGLEVERQLVCEYSPPGKMVPEQ